MNMIEVVFIILHAHLAIGVLFVWNGLEQGGVVPQLKVVIVLVGAAEVLLVFASSSLLDPIKVLHHELFLSLGHTRTIAIRRDHVEFVNIILLAQA